MANVEAIAKGCNVTVRRVYQLVDAGMPKKGRGEFDLGRCMAWYIKHMQAELERRGPEGTAAAARMAIQRAALTAAQRERVELDNAVQRGELVEREAVRQDWALRVTNAQKALRAMPTSMGPTFTNIPDARVITKRVRRETDSILHELEHGSAKNAQSRRRSRVP